MDKTYLQRRKGKNYTSYRLNKRKEVIIDKLKGLLKDKNHSVLDLGAADGQLLHEIATHFDYAVGIDISEEAIRIAAKSDRLKILLGDCTNLPFKNDFFDLLIASAVLEHIDDIDSALKESDRVLKRNGIFCITLPNPVYDWINSKLVKTYHVRRYRLKTMIKLVESYGYRVVESSYFMLCPFGQFPFEGYISKVLKLVKLDFLLFNYLVIGLKEIS